MPYNRRTWTWQGFAGYWVIAGMLIISILGSFAQLLLGINTTPWTVGSTLLALGLSVGQAMGIVICATFVIALLAVGAGWPGSHQHIGFTVLSRRYCKVSVLMEAFTDTVSAHGVCVVRFGRF